MSENAAVLQRHRLRSSSAEKALEVLADSKLDQSHRDRDFLSRGNLLPSSTHVNKDLRIVQKGCHVAGPQHQAWITILVTFSLQR